MAYATLRFYAELNDFLPAQRRQRDWTLTFEPPAPARHLIETCGVPHTEVELILREGASIGLETPVGDGDRLAVYPMFESCDVRPLLRLRPRPLRRLRFLADAHLGALARRLRMLGFDTVWHNDLGDGPLARLAVLEHRILDALVHRLDLCAEIAPFTRCMACNETLMAVDPTAVQTEVPPAVYRRHQEYRR